MRPREKEEKEMRTKYWWENLNERVHLTFLWGMRPREKEEKEMRTKCWWENLHERVHL